MDPCYALQDRRGDCTGSRARPERPYTGSPSKRSSVWSASLGLAMSDSWNTRCAGWFATGDNGVGSENRCVLAKAAKLYTLRSLLDETGLAPARGSVTPKIWKATMSQTTTLEIFSDFI